MKSILTYLVLGAIILVTAAQCSTVRTRAQTMRVQRVRRIEDALDG
jgi:hypothetical protein